MKSFFSVNLFFLSFCFNLQMFAQASAFQETIDQNAHLHLGQDTHVGIGMGVLRDNLAQAWGVGETELGSGNIPGGDTVFEIGSITKVFTATLLAVEVVRGSVSLTSTVQSLWPESRGTAVGEITLEQLATHTSGLPRMPSNFLFTNPADPYADYTPELMKQFLLGWAGPTGTLGFDYSNLGVGLLGYLLATYISQSDFQSYLTKEILFPLGMMDTSVLLNGDQQRRLAQPYDEFLRPGSLWNLNVMGPAGGLRSTVNDLLKFARIQLDPNLVRTQSPILAEAIRLTQMPRHLINPRSGTWIGLGWFLKPSVGGFQSRLFHSGKTGSYLSELVIDPSIRLATVQWTNTGAAAECLVEVLFNPKCRVQQRPSLIGAGYLKQLEGIYELSGTDFKITIQVINGKLGLVDRGVPVRLYPLGTFEFQAPGLGLTVTFEPPVGIEPVPSLRVQQGGFDKVLVRSP